MEQKVFYKNDTIRLKTDINSLGLDKVFLVRANESYFISGAELFIKNLFGNKKLDSYIPLPNPEFNDLKKALSLFRKGSYNLIVAIGGGSVLDSAKILSILTDQNTGIEDIIKTGKIIETRKTPLLAIPTTAGSGAEATQFAVLYHNKKKYSIESPIALPDYVYLSPEFLLSASPYLTACTGLDAFCQAIESVWSVRANEESENYALEAIAIIWDNLHKAVKENNVSAKEKMQRAAYLSGRAINITRTTAPHALSYAFTSYYNIPHGHAVALSLPFFLRFNYAVSFKNCNDLKGPEEVKKRIEKVVQILNIGIVEAPVSILNFIKSLDINLNIRSLVNNFNPNTIVDNVNIERLSNNPRIVRKNDIMDFLNS